MIRYRGLATEERRAFYFPICHVAQSGAFSVWCRIFFSMPLVSCALQEFVFEVFQDFKTSQVQISRL